MVDGKKMRHFMQNMMMVQTSFRVVIQKGLKRNKIDVTFEMLQILTYLDAKDGVNQQELACKTFKDKSSLTSLLKNMEHRELIVRKEDLTDRRNKNVCLTDKGHDAMLLIRPMLNDIYTMVGEQVDANHLNLSINYLEELNDEFKKLL